MVLHVLDGFALQLYLPILLGEFFQLSCSAVSVSLFNCSVFSINISCSIVGSHTNVTILHVRFGSDGKHGYV